jgi:hypothetical protein
MTTLTFRNNWTNRSTDCCQARRIDHHMDNDTLVKISLVAKYTCFDKKEEEE